VSLDNIGKGQRHTGKINTSGEQLVRDAGSIAALGSVLAALGGGISNFVSTNNSTQLLLGSGAIYTGVYEDCVAFAAVSVALVIDRSGTINVDFSNDGVTLVQTQSYPFAPDTPGVAKGFFLQLMAEAKYFRLRYINGATAQGVFIIQSIFKIGAGTAEVHAVNTSLLANTDALVTKGVIYGLTTGGGGGYVAVKVNPSGALTADVTQSGTWNITTITNPVTTLGKEESSAIDQASSSLIYFGKAAFASATSGAVWKIKKMSLSGNVWSTTWADGNNNYDNIWDNRASLTYS
jgi:hypothetical protein